MARFTKTQLGREEIAARKMAFDRPTRNLLLIIDPSRDGEDWLQMVHGAEAGALAALEEAGLIERANAPAASAAAPARAPRDEGRGDARSAPGMGSLAGPDSVLRPAGESSLDDDALYERLNGVVKAQLGLVQGLRMTLAIEQADGREALCAVARQVIALVREHRGESAAASVSWTLGFEA